MILYTKSNVVHHRVGHPTKSATKPQRGNCATTQCDTTTKYSTVRNRMILFRSIVTICVLNFYLTSAGVVPNLAATAAAPLYAHSLRRHLAVLNVKALGWIQVWCAEGSSVGSQGVSERGWLDGGSGTDTE